jgi:hypothetical protein
MRDADLPLYFRLFNEIGIIEQLSRARFEARLPQGAPCPHFSVLNHLMRVEDGRTPLELARAFQVPKTTLPLAGAAGEAGVGGDEARTPMTGGRNGSGSDRCGPGVPRGGHREIAPDLAGSKR